MQRRPLRFYLLPRVIRSLLQPRTTVAFPFGPLDLNDAYRGRVIVDIDACRACGLCARDCPTGGLTVERFNGGGVRLVLREDLCANCGQCEESCPRGAIRLAAAFVPATDDREALYSEWLRAGEDATDEEPADRGLACRRRGDGF